MYITSKHIQILKLIKTNDELKVKDISCLFHISPQHVKLYLEDIYSEIYQSTPIDIKTNSLIEKISSSSNGKSALKKVQQFSKNEKLFYLLFRLIKDKTVNISFISIELGITKRNLNYYLNEISPFLNEHHLKIITTNKGLKFFGNSYSLKKIKYYMIFKFLIEKNFLPIKIRNEVLSFLKIKNFYKLRKDLYSFINLIKIDTTTLNVISLFSFFMAFRGNDNDKKIKDLDISTSLKYKPINFTNEFFFKILYFLKTSSFKD
ncbi:MAG: hypothetical protein ACRC0V_00285, partial [Fusobacteriaceae bacterium]